MQRRHAEDAFSGQLEGGDLQYHRQGFHHEHSAHDEQHDLLAHDDGDGAERGAQRQRADVAHEHLRRVGVEPQEREARPRNRAADHRELAGAGYIGKAQVLGKHRVPGDVGEDAERAADHHRGHDGEPVEPVGQVHRVAGADDHEIRHDDETERAERVRHLLEERHDELGLRRQVGIESEEYGRGEADHRLPEKLGLRRQPLGIARHHLAIIVHPADRAEAERHPQHDPDQPVLQVGPQQHGDDDSRQDQRPAHGGRAGLAEVRLRAVVAHRLADFVRGELPDQQRPDDEGDDERGEAGQHRAQRDVVDYVESADILGEPLGEF